jgi:hypothetical protein
LARSPRRCAKLYKIIDSRTSSAPRSHDRLERATASPRAYRGLPELTYPFHDRSIIVIACGRLCLQRKKINISTVLAGQTLGIKEVDDGVWLVTFMDYDLGYIDLEQRTLQPLDNPFGPRIITHVSDMAV